MMHAHGATGKHSHPNYTFTVQYRLSACYWQCSRYCVIH